MERLQPFSTFTLPQGLRVVCAPGQTDVVYLGIAVDAGTRDELASESGMAHFTEHMSFKGTRQRSARQVISAMESVGGELNAFTGKEETLYYCTCLGQHVSRAIGLLLDIALQSTYPQEEMNREVEVVIDEIESYQDQPSELIYDEFESLLFPRHPLGRNILGDAEALRSFRTADMQRFASRLYHPHRMVFYVLGNMDPEQVLRVMEKNITRYDGKRNTLCLPTTRVTFANDTREVSHITRKKDTHQAHVMMGSRAYEGHSKKKLMLYLLTNLLGGTGMNSRLNVALREKRGLVYEVEANSTSYTDTGTFSIYFGCDLEDVERCVGLTKRELKKLCEKALTISQLQALKKQTMGQIGVAQDNRENNALGMAKTFLHYDRFVTTEEVYRNMDRLTPVHLLEVANEVFGEQNLSTLIYR